MGNPITGLLRRGGLPDDARAGVEAEGVLLLEEGLRASVTYRDYRAPGRRSSLRRDWTKAALAVTKERLAVYVGGRPFVNVPFGDDRFAALAIDRQDRDLAIAFDPSAFDPSRSGGIEVRVRPANASAALALIRSQQR